VDELLKPENKEKLVAILAYHVVAGDVMAAQVMKRNSAKTVNGQSVYQRKGRHADGGQREGSEGRHHMQQWRDSRDRYGADA
jgi:hypothetical protein